ncbi:MAG: YHYH protein [Pseudomonadota bacterium]
MRRIAPYVLAATLTALAVTAFAAASKIAVTDTAGLRCITSNGLPDHETGTFPNPMNPHGITVQQIEACLAASPVKGDREQPVKVTGIAKNGVLIRPGTADYYDASSPRGHSRDPSSGWNLDGMGASETLGLDAQNGHVGPRGAYHYHGVPNALTDLEGSTFVGWAADGFEIHYLGDQARPSYRLKSGQRDSAPGGAHDGTYNGDWEYILGYGNLDQCNGATVNGQYIYFATDGYPFFPRCLYGTEITRIR